MAEDAIPRSLGGDEEVVVFKPADEFVGVTPDWLLPRLRLDPSISPLEDADSICVYVNGEEFSDEFPNDELPIFGPGPQRDYLMGLGDGRMLSACWEIQGQWVRFSVLEVCSRLFHIGANQDFRAVCHSLVSAIDEYWDIYDEDQVVDLSSPFLDAGNPEDQDLARSYSDGSIPVFLNGTELQ